jgi:hypothetical protein
MLWILLFAGVLFFAWWLFAPRRLQTLENIPAVVDEEFNAHDLVESVAEEEEVRPMAERAAKKVSDIPAPGHGDSLTFDWPNDKMAEPHGAGERPTEGPLNNQ